MQSTQSKLSLIRWTALCGALSTPLLAAANLPPDPSRAPTIRVETRVVQIDVVFTDPDGKPVTSLTKGDFTLTDRGRQRVIDIFSVSDGQSAPAVPPSQPLPPHVFSNRNTPPVNVRHSTVILVDANPANPKLDEYVQWANASRQATGLIRSLLPDEQIALYVVSRQEGLLLLQDFTTDRNLLLRSLGSYKPRGLRIGSPWAVYETAKEGPDMPPETPLTESPRRDPNFVPKREKDYLTDNSVRENRLSLQTLADRLALVPGRKNVFWATAGFSSTLMHDMGQIPWDHTITALNEANVAVSTGGCSTAADELAERTGGSSVCEGDPSAATLIAASRTTYTLGFYLQDGERDDEFHSLKVRVDRPHAQLFYRQGYYAGKTPDALHERKPELETALLNQADSTGVGITARVEATPGSPRGTLTIHLNLDPATLSLRENADGWAGDVEEEFVEMTESGNTLAKISDKKEFDVANANRAAYDSQGVNWPLSLPLVQGATRIAIVVRDSKTGNIGSLTIPLR